jgi:hypothetical protein
MEQYTNDSGRICYGVNDGGNVGKTMGKTNPTPKAFASLELGAKAQPRALDASFCLRAGRK